jgi:hypothetical protein
MEREIPAEYVPTADQRALVENAAAFGRPFYNRDPPHVP